VLVDIRTVTSALPPENEHCETRMACPLWAVVSTGQRLCCIDRLSRPLKADIALANCFQKQEAAWAAYANCGPIPQNSYF